MSVFKELKRRKVIKVGGAYLVVAWLVVQAASIGFPAFEAPPWALRVFIFVVMLGFPTALVPLLADPQAKELLRRFGFVAYWREKGWPALCHPVGADDFQCPAATKE